MEGKVFRINAGKTKVLISGPGLCRVSQRRRDKLHFLWELFQSGPKKMQWYPWLSEARPQPDPRQDGRHLPDDIFKCIFLNEHVKISINISLKFVTKVELISQTQTQTQTKTQTKFIQQKYIQVPYQVYMSFLEIQTTL